MMPRVITILGIFWPPYTTISCNSIPKRFGSSTVLVSPYFRSILSERVTLSSTACLISFTVLAWTKVFKSMWKDFESTFNSILNDLGRQCDLLDRVAGAQHMEQSQIQGHRLEELFDNYKSDRDKLWQTLGEHEKDRARNHREEVLKWIASATMSDIHEEYCKKRQICPKSGDWVLHKDRFVGWKELDVPTNPILWMHGIPGAGENIRNRGFDWYIQTEGANG